jgi:hypothetical protein
LTLTDHLLDGRESRTRSWLEHIRCGSRCITAELQQLQHECGVV